MRAFLAQSRMINITFFAGRDPGQLRDAFHVDLRGFVQTKRQFVAVDLQFHRVAHRSELHDRDFRTGNHAHIQKVLTKGTFTADTGYTPVLADFQISNCCFGIFRHNLSPLTKLIRHYNTVMTNRR